MTELFKLVGVITVDGMKEAEKGITNLEKGVKKSIRPMIKFGKQVEQVGFQITKSFTVPLIAAGIAATKAGKIASDLNETIAKTGEIFEESAGDIEEWSKTADKAMGQSRQQAMDAAGTFGIFASSAGLAGKELVKFSTDFTELASDFASFYNTSPEDAIVAIGAALRGENEPIRRYGILLDDATLRQKALKMGIIDTIKKALTPQQKVLAASKVIMDQSKKAQGDFIRTSKGFANQTRIMKAEIENMAAELGQSFLPIMLDVVRIIREEVVPKVKAMVKWWTGLNEATRVTIIKLAAMVAVAGPLLMLFGKLIASIKMITTVITIAKLAMIGLNATLMANPFIAVATAIGVLGFAVYKLIKRQQELKKVTDASVKSLMKMNDAAERSAAVAKAMREEWEKDPLFDSAKFKKRFKERWEAYNKAGINSYSKMQETRQAFEDKEDADAKRIAERKSKATEKERLANEALMKAEEAAQKTIDGLVKQGMDKRRVENEVWAKKVEEIKELRIQNEDTVFQLVKERMDKIRDIREQNNEEVMRVEEEHAKAVEKYDREEAQRQRELNNNKISAVQNAFSLFSMFNDNAAIATENNYKKEKEGIENSQRSEEEKAAAVEKLDEKFNKKRMAIRKRQAIADKAAALFAIGVNTAVAVTKALPNLILASIVGALGALQGIAVASKPIPQMAEGGIIKRRTGGTLVNAGEAGQDEGYVPMKTGVATIADAIVNQMKSIAAVAPISSGMPQLAGAGSGTTNNFNMGTVIANRSSMKELARDLMDIMESEKQRRGANG